MMVSNQQI